MTEIHDLSSPRNLYEKLVRDGEKLEKELNGDNVFNFVSTAFHLQHWIKNSPLIASEVMKRILKRISKEPNIKYCQDIARAEKHFKLEISDSTASLVIDDVSIDVISFRDNILQLYSNYFSVKGR